MSDDILTLLEFHRRKALADGKSGLATVLDRACGEIVEMRGRITPSGHIMVPEEPTEEMMERGLEQWSNLRDIWAAMLKAAPKNPGNS